MKCVARGGFFSDVLDEFVLPKGCLYQMPLKIATLPHNLVLNRVFYQPWIVSRKHSSGPTLVLVKLVWKLDTRNVWLLLRWNQPTCHFGVVDWVVVSLPPVLHMLQVGMLSMCDLFSVGWLSETSSHLPVSIVDHSSSTRCSSNVHSNSSSTIYHHQSILLLHIHDTSHHYSGR